MRRLMTLQTRGSDVVDANGEAIRLKGVNIGGWLNMENFITGYAANETMMRSAVRKVLGDDGYELFFERLLSAFYADADAAFLAETGLNCVRIPVNYRHLESDARPFEIIEDGFRHLDRAIATGGEHGVYTIIDLHALPGSQNQHWHSDNPSHRALFWEHRHFQDRVVGIWEAIADRYKGNPWVAGYNLMNEPADESRAVVGPFYERLAAAIREIDARAHPLLRRQHLLDRVRLLRRAVGRTPCTPCMTMCRPASAAPTSIPGPSRRRPSSASARNTPRRTGTPIYVGEFAPIYTGDEAVDAVRRRILDDQLQIYRRYGAGFATWMYKDLGRQGLTSVRPDSPYGALVADFVAKKRRLGVDQWGSTGRENPEVTQPIQDLVAREAPEFDPYPWGRFDFVRTLVLNITLAQPLTGEYAELFRGLGEDELVALADSFAFENCAVRESLRDQLSAA